MLSPKKRCNLNYLVKCDAICLAIFVRSDRIHTVVPYIFEDRPDRLDIDLGLDLESRSRPFPMDRSLDITVPDFCMLTSSIIGFLRVKGILNLM